MRALWVGSINFVLLNVPVKLFNATEDHSVHFRDLCGRCNTPITLKRWCPKCERPVAYENLKKGFPIEKNRFVVFTQDELAALEPGELKRIIVEKFVNISEVNPIAYDSFYFIAPEKGAEHAYAVLQKALSLQNKAMVARLVMREKEKLCVIQSFGTGLLLCTLHYADEIRNTEAVVSGLIEPADEEVRLAVQLIEKLTGRFKLDDYKDTYRQKIEKLAKQKEAGKEIKIEALPKPVAPRDLMTELRRSIEAVESSAV